MLYHSTRFRHHFTSEFNSCSSSIFLQDWVKHQEIQSPDINFSIWSNIVKQITTLKYHKLSADSPIQQIVQNNLGVQRTSLNVNWEWAKSLKVAASSTYKVQQECMLSHGFFLFFLKLLQLCLSLSPRSFSCHSLLQLSLFFFFFCLPAHAQNPECNQENIQLHKVSNYIWCQHISMSIQETYASGPVKKSFKAYTKRK